MFRRILLLALFGPSFLSFAGDFPKTLYAFPGKTPKLDGVISPGEWNDAVLFSLLREELEE